MSSRGIEKGEAGMEREKGKGGASGRRGGPSRPSHQSLRLLRGERLVERNGVTDVGRTHALHHVLRHILRHILRYILRHILRHAERPLSSSSRRASIEQFFQALDAGVQKALI